MWPAVDYGVMAGRRRHPAAQDLRLALDDHEGDAWGVALAERVEGGVRDAADRPSRAIRSAGAPTAS